MGDKILTDLQIVERQNDLSAVTSDDVAESHTTLRASLAAAEKRAKRGSRKVDAIRHDIRRYRERAEKAEAALAAARREASLRRDAILRLRDTIRAMRKAPPTDEHRRWVALMDGTPDGTRPMTVYARGTEVIVCGDPPSERADAEPIHNCDDMGCTSVSHVLWRGSYEAFCAMCAEEDTTRREAQAMREALKWCADQFCQQDAEGSSDDTPCSETGACITEWCLPCYCKATLADRAASVDRPAPDADRRRVLCLCGSTRFKRAWQEWNARLTLDGNVVLSVAMWSHAERMSPTAEQKATLDAVHLSKIDLSDEVFVLDVGGYIGDSTRNEIRHAEAAGKPVRYLSREHPEWTEDDCQWWQDRPAPDAVGVLRRLIDFPIWDNDERKVKPLRWHLTENCGEPGRAILAEADALVGVRDGDQPDGSHRATLIISPESREFMGLPAADFKLHQERWRKIGWHVEWSDEARGYLVCPLRAVERDEACHTYTAETVADVDEWIAAQADPWGGDDGQG